MRGYMKKVNSVSAQGLEQGEFYLRELLLLTPYSCLPCRTTGSTASS